MTVDDWIARHGDRALALLRSVLRNAEDAHDAWQETFTALWRSAHRVRDDVDAWPYIRRTALRKALDRLERRRGRAAREVPLESEPASPVDRGVAVEFDFAGLDEEEHLAIVLFFWGGRSIREISMHLELPENTVKSRLFRARAKLRKNLIDRGFAP
ncbi:MAG: sigma-70 family RNA polymerase sigma factor [Planctomycetes bacterium]|nr:sigma-70 family RNA polymerase sigma factor [Planctomycetota bacterium]